MTAKFVRWIVFITILISNNAAKGETIKGHLSTGATHHRIVIVVPTSIRHVNHIHHFPLKGHKSGTNPRYIYYKIPLGSIKPYVKCNSGDHRHSGKGKPVPSSGYNPDSTTPGPKGNGYHDSKNTVDYQDKPPESGGPPVTSQENGYYDDSYSDQGPTQGPSPGPPYYDGPRYSDSRPTDPPPPPPPPPYISDINRYSYNGHGGAGSGSFPGTSLGHNIRFGKYFHDFGSRPNRNKHTFNHGFKSSTTGSGFDYGYGSPGRYKHTEKIKIILPSTGGKYTDDFPYRFSHEKKSPIRKNKRPSFSPIRNVESPVETNYHSFNGNNNAIPPSVYTSPVYDDNFDKPVGSDGGGKDVDPYDYPNTEIGPNDFNDNYQFVHESDELKAELGLTSEEAENFPSAEYPSDPPKVNADGPLSGHVTSTLAPIVPSQPDPLQPPELTVTDFPYFDNDGLTSMTPTDDFFKDFEKPRKNGPSSTIPPDDFFKDFEKPRKNGPTSTIPPDDFFKDYEKPRKNGPTSTIPPDDFYKDFEKPKKKTKYVSYVNGPFSGPPSTPSTDFRDKDNDFKIEKQKLIRLQPIVTSAEFNRPPFTSYDKVIGHGRAMYEANSDFKFDSNFEGRYEVPFEPHRLQSKMVGKGIPPENNAGMGGRSGGNPSAHQKSSHHSNVHQSPVTDHQSSVTNLKDRIHQIHGYVPKEEQQTITLIKTGGN